MVFFLFLLGSELQVVVDSTWEGNGSCQDRKSPQVTKQKA
jgi:hypothetical protein